MTTSLPNPRRGEIWLVDFGATVGQEMYKTRPAVVISHETLGYRKLRLVVPVTGWDPSYDGEVTIVKLPRDSRTNLDKVSAADTIQTRSASLERFTRHLGRVAPDLLEEIACALATLVGAPV